MTIALATSRPIMPAPPDLRAMIPQRARVKNSTERRRSLRSRKERSLRSRKEREALAERTQRTERTERNALRYRRAVVARFRRAEMHAESVAHHGLTVAEHVRFRRDDGNLVAARCQPAPRCLRPA